MMRRRGLLLAAALFVVGGAFVVARTRRFTRVAVHGHSMEPHLRDGDWLIVDQVSDGMTCGDIVVARDPRMLDRLIVKRVARVGTDSELMLMSDHPAHVDEIIGPIRAVDVVGRVRLRYWPLAR
jgi:signal peptidase I